MNHDDSSVIYAQAAFYIIHCVNPYTRHHFHAILRRQPTALVVENTRCFWRKTQYAIFKEPRFGANSHKRIIWLTLKR